MPWDGTLESRQCVKRKKFLTTNLRAVVDKIVIVNFFGKITIFFIVYHAALLLFQAVILRLRNS